MALQAKGIRLEMPRVGQHVRSMWLHFVTHGPNIAIDPHLHVLQSVHVNPETKQRSHILSMVAESGFFPWQPSSFCGN